MQQTHIMLTPELNDQITMATKRLQAGETVAFPTETVYGLGADISIPAAIQKIYTIKGRPTDHPLIVHFADILQLPHWAQAIPDSAWTLAKHFWPGPLTLILQRSQHIPQTVTGGQDTVGLRIPNHPVALALLKKLGPDKALAAPSANRFGRISPTTAAHVQEELGQTPGMILDGGACTVGLESTIVCFSGQNTIVLRPGGIPVAALEAVLNSPVILSNTDRPTIRAPGTLASHYAPTTPLEIHSTQTIWQHAYNLATQGLRSVVIEWSGTNTTRPKNEYIQHFSMSQEPEAYGKQLYMTLRLFDQTGLNRLLVEAPPDHPAWLAISDRLQRACYNP